MLQSLIQYFSQKFLSRWIVLALDATFVWFLFYLAVLIRFNFNVPDIDLDLIHQQSLFVTLFYVLQFLISGSYKGIIRQTGLMDAYLLFKASSVSAVMLLVLCSLSVYHHNLYFFDIPRSIIIIHYLLVVFVLLGSRFSIKSVYLLALRKTTSEQGHINVLIYGSGAAGIITRQSLSRELIKRYKVIAYVDDNPSKQGKIQDGLTILKREQALNERFIQDKKVNQLIIAVQNMDNATRKQIIQTAVNLNLKVKVVPPVRTWIQGELTTKQLKTVKIEDLLQRDAIQLDSLNIKRELNKKTVLVTGAAGSIGSEITRQILHYDPARVIAIDQAESALYDLEMDLLNNNREHHDRVTFVVADVTDALRMQRIFENSRPEMVFHAAAYKHVPLMEAQPYEALHVNVFGTKLLADLACKWGVEKFVMVSTDKAVNPTNVMGASKRLAEMYVQHLNDQKVTKFITTRFGNVLGSNGSVIPLFKKQIEKGGPLTITHPDITRFFMTIPEACNLVLEAGAMGQGGEIYVFDMGDPVKIMDLAKNMIRLSGFKVDEDIKIVCSGLRPGEKLYEELLASTEHTKPTYHEKILIAEVRKEDAHQLIETLSSMQEALSTSDDETLVKWMKSLIPEFKSNNSIYSSLD